MEVQSWIKMYGVESLGELGITVKRHESLPLMILNYSQIDSPKTHPVVRECRGLVLNTDDFSLVARAFPRFFNLGEIPEEDKDFQFVDCEIQSKEDGSLMLLYWFNGSWRINTRNGFGDGDMDGTGMTWEQGFCSAMGVKNLVDFDINFSLPKNVTYVLEFCSKWNKIVRRYEVPTCYLLTGYFGGQELSSVLADEMANGVFLRPTVFQFRDIDELRGYLKDNGEVDPTFEGFVLRDPNGKRLKVKSERYLNLHRIRGNNGSIVHPKHLLPFVLSGEDSELLTYFPEVREEFEHVKAVTESAYRELSAIWNQYKNVADQKEFALAVKDHRLSPVLFTVRKKKADLREEWLKSGDLILNRLFPVAKETQVELFKEI